MVRDIRALPFPGKGKTESLKHNLSGFSLDELSMNTGLYTE
ncbi:hypothetical protein [Candidatus Williamhamiltonella defendens]